MAEGLTTPIKAGLRGWLRLVVVVEMVVASDFVGPNPAGPRCWKRLLLLVTSDFAGPNPAGPRG